MRCRSIDYLVSLDCVIDIRNWPVYLEDVQGFLRWQSKPSWKSPKAVKDICGRYEVFQKLSTFRNCYVMEDLFNLMIDVLVIRIIPHQIYDFHKGVCARTGNGWWRGDSWLSSPKTRTLLFRLLLNKKYYVHSVSVSRHNSNSLTLGCARSLTSKQVLLICKGM